MIISKTPFRISFVGGGTDFRDFYKHNSGAVISSAINKYMYITINKFFDNRIILKYSKTELVDKVEEIKHPLLREALKLTGLTKGIEVTSMSDVPGGTGLGSSSAFVVGLLNALYAYKGELKSSKDLAEKAAKIEVDILKEPIGKQDQYITAYGGLKFIRFNEDDSVFVDPISLPKDIKKKLEKRLILFYTGTTRRAKAILYSQKKRTNQNLEILTKMKESTFKLKEEFNDNCIDNLGKYLDKGWLLKKKLSDNISNPVIDSYYRSAKSVGAVGGKLLGAGGGGFILLYANENNKKAIREKLKDLREIDFKLEPEGSKIIYVGE